MEPGETIAETAIRETKEETGLDVELDRLVGIYSNPNHVVEYSDGEVRQQFSVVVASLKKRGVKATSNESLEVGFYSPARIERLAMHESIRLRIRHCLEHQAAPVVA